MHPTPGAFAIATLVAMAASPALAQGYHASSSARAAVIALPSGTVLSPWAVQVNDGYGHTTSSFNTAATAPNAGGSSNGKTVQASAYADLATGKLGVATSAVNTLATTDAAASTAALASFGDSFRLGSTSGGAFAWDGSSLATFGITLHGSSSNTTSRTFLDWSLWINIFSAGTLAQPASRWFDGLLGSVQWDSNLRSDGQATIFTNTQAGSIGLTGGYAGTLNSDTLNLGASFRPGADFDWTITLYSAAGGLSTQLGAQVADLLHTATVDFYAPAGAVTASGSGVFPNTTPVPENGTLALLAAGLAALWPRLRHRR